MRADSVSCFCLLCGLILSPRYKLQKNRRINLMVQRYKKLTGPICLLKEYKDKTGLKGPIIYECSYFLSIGGTVGPKVCRSRWAKSTSQVLGAGWKELFPFSVLIALGHRDNETQQCTNGGLADGKRITLREGGRDKWEFLPWQAQRVMHLSSTVTFFVLFFLQTITRGCFFLF